MFACDCIVTTAEGDTSLSRGSFFTLPPELGGIGKISHYSSLDRAGWHKIENGYLAFVRIAPDGTRYCFPGVIPTDPSFRNRWKVPANFTEKTVEEYVAALEAQEKKINASIREDFNLLVHDLRRLSTVIYTTAEDAKQSSTTVADPALLRLIDNIIGAQSMLRIRIDMVDFSGSPMSPRTKGHVQVFKKIDKVIRSFRPLSERSHVRLQLSGSSFSTSYGPEVLEILTYILIDNAIKYSPHNGEVKININDVGDKINFSVSSIGPEVKPHEITKIFERGYRGEMTRQRTDAGSGLGLFLCSRIINDFGGRIWVTVGDKDIQTTKGVSRDIQFNVELPMSSPY